MAESSHQYVERILSYVDGANPLEVLAATPPRLTVLIAGVDDARLSRRPAPDKWSPQEIVAHLADTELVLGYRVRQILQTSGIAIQAFDQDQWAVIGQYQRIPAARSVERLRLEREANLELLRSLTPAQRVQHGVHAERGKETIERIQLLWAGHDINHCRQVQRILNPA